MAEEHDGECDGCLNGKGEPEVGEPACVAEGEQVILDTERERGEADGEGEFPFIGGLDGGDGQVALAEDPLDGGVEEAVGKEAAKDHIEGEGEPDQGHADSGMVGTEDRERGEVEERHGGADRRENGEGEEVERGGDGG